jgi:putative acetyltransferase
MISIVPIKEDQVKTAKSLIAEVAGGIFYPEKSSEEFAAILDEEHELDDVDNFKQVYGGDRGIFLVVLDGERVVGTGAFKPFDEQTAELKRLWLLEKYHGKGIGYMLIMKLFESARQAGYRRMILQTDILSVRAISFYKRLGFEQIPAFYPDAEDGDLFFGIALGLKKF